MFGYGHVTQPARIRRIKRSFRRACKRALLEGHTTYKGRTFWSVDVAFRNSLKLERSTCAAPSLKRPPQSPKEALRFFSWNAGRSLNYHEWLSWCAGRNEDVLFIQESGWQMNGQWTTDDWYCIHSHDASASLLLMVRRKLLRPSLLAYAVLIPGKLIHLRLMFSRVHDVYAVYQTAWNTTKSVTTLLRERQDMWHRLRQGILHIPNNPIVTCLSLQVILTVPYSKPHHMSEVIIPGLKSPPNR